MARPLVRRQITIPLFPTTTSQTSPTPAIPTTTSTTPGSVPPLTSIVSVPSSLLGPVLSLASTLSTAPLQTAAPFSSTITPSVSSVSSLSPTSTPPLLTTGPNGPITITETSSSTVPPPSGTPDTRGKSFLENKPLAGFVFGLSGVAALIIVVIAVTSYKRRRNRKRLLADASNFSFDPRDIEDRAPDEKHSHSGLIDRHNNGRGHNDYASDKGATGGFTGVNMGGVPRLGLSSPPVPAYIPQDYSGHDGTYPTQYHHLSNIPVGYNPTPNPYDMYGLGNGGGYSIGQSQHDPYNTSGLSGDPSITDSGHPVPRQLQPGLHPAQGPIFAPHLSTSPPPLNRSPNQSTTSPPPASIIQRLPTPGALPNTFGRQNSVDDDAYGGAFLGHGSPPGPRTLQVANM